MILRSSGRRDLGTSLERSTLGQCQRALVAMASGDRFDCLAQTAGPPGAVRIGGDEVADAHVEQPPAALGARLAVTADEGVRVEAHQGAFPDQLEEELGLPLHPERALRLGEHALEAGCRMAAACSRVSATSSSKENHGPGSSSKIARVPSST